MRHVDASLPPTPRPWLRAAVWLLVLGPFFFLSYGFANTMAAGRAEVPSVVFAWERAVPFWPWTIVPYWSIDVLYALSLFVCRSRRELDIHAVRLFAVQLMAVACFLLFPLTFSFQRPPVEGVFGALFDVLAGFDKPFNQAPSLHIALLVVLWVRFARHLTAPTWRAALHVWMALIGVSVLTTYQHHFIDVPTGALVGWLAVWLWPQHGLRAPWQRTPQRLCTTRVRLALLYLGAAAALAWAAVCIAGAALWLLWPAVSLLLVAWCYAWCGASGLQKRSDGRLTAAARWLLWPYHVAAWRNSRWWTRQHPQPARVAADVWLGRLPDAGERDGFGQVVDVCAELPLRDARAGDVVVPMLDLVVPDRASVLLAVEAIAAAQAQGRVLVCCALGYSRSALCVAAWLLLSGRERDVASALARLARAQPRLVLRPGHLALLHALLQPSAAAADAARTELR